MLELFRYHVPRSFLRDETNTLVLFEEFGGNPSAVKFQTVKVGAAYATVDEGNVVELSCQGGTISDVKFASFGDPQGTGGSFSKGKCESAQTLSAVHKVKSKFRSPVRSYSIEKSKNKILIHLSYNFAGVCW